MNYWIVSKHNYTLYTDGEKAVLEAERLQEQERRPFYVFRVKGRLMLDNKPGRVVLIPLENKEQINE